MLDKSKLPPGLWARMLWVPSEPQEPTDRPIVLVSDRRRFWLAGIPMVAAFALAAAFFFLHGPRSVVIALLLMVLAIAWLGRRSGAAYYEVRADGKLGAHLGSRPPAALRDMRRTPL